MPTEAPRAERTKSLCSTRCDWSPFASAALHCFAFTFISHCTDSSLTSMIPTPSTPLPLLQKKTLLALGFVWSWPLLLPSAHGLLCDVLGMGPVTHFSLFPSCTGLVHGFGVLRRFATSPLSLVPLPSSVSPVSPISSTVQRAAVTTRGALVTMALYKKTPLYIGDGS